jgi:hypothetical protein
VQQGVRDLGHTSSASQFITQGLADLLRALGLLLDGVLAVSNAFLDGFLATADSRVNLLFAPTTGLLNQPLNIPVLPWLYQKLTGEHLTILNVVTLVAAIPVTILWRVVEGEWPSQSLGAAGAAVRVGVSGLVVQIMTVFGGIVAIANGIISAVVDASVNEPEFANQWAAGQVVCGMWGAIFSFPCCRTPVPPSDLAWAGWGGALGLTTINAIGIFGSGTRGAAAAVLEYLVPWIEALLSIALLTIVVAKFVDEKGRDPVQDVAFAAGLTSVLPGLINPVKELSEELALVVAVVDGVMGWATGILSFVEAGLE